MDARFSFRVIGISRSEAETIGALGSGYDFRVTKYFKDKNLYVFSLKIVPNIDYSQLWEFTKNLNEVKYDVFVSVSTRSDTMIVDVPEFVTKFVRETSCQLTFSFTVT